MTCDTLNPMPGAAAFRRPADQVMQLPRLGVSHPTRLSFLRQMLRRLQSEAWVFDRPVWQIDARGVGRATYRAVGRERSYTLVAFAHDLPADQRSDRVIATAWDATFALYDGTPTQEDLDRLAANVPLQEAGRISPRELTLSRANRSVRLFDHVIDKLALGQQPDAALLEQTGYLMRTTAVYGSGKFGAADRCTVATRPELAAPFQAEMLTVWFIRAFSVDLVEHLAQMRGGGVAVRLNPELRRGLGVGNSTGLGMAPFLIRHPILLNNWIMAREEALARVRALPIACNDSQTAFAQALSEARGNAAHWQSGHPLQVTRLTGLRADLSAIADHLAQGPDVLSAPHPWDRLWRWGQEHLQTEGQEALLALLLEPQGALVDGLGDCMQADEDAGFAVQGAMSLADLHAILVKHYGWAQAFDFTDPAVSARFWYVSEEKHEPRLGQRQTEEGAAREEPLDIARQAQALAADLCGACVETVAEFALLYPQHRMMIRRVQISARHPYAEIQANLLAEDMLPIDLLRCKLAFFGASRFDPRSDRWVRISLFQGAPFPDEMVGAALNPSGQHQYG